MMLPGYCEGCRRVKTVRVNSAGMTQVAMGRTPTGQCGSCADAEERKRREAWEARRGRR